ncbi:tetratricopeptide repeat protein [Croceitalea marina]|uniref:histidine kinase n=1 Tax=Croceitalea marina TaxID=1775166 RepID=A0ABW5MUU1_9FLAO
MKHDSKIESISDSISFYFNISTDTNLPIDDRFKAVNRLYFHLKKNEKDTIYGHVLYQKNMLHLSLEEQDSLSIYNDELIDYALKNDDIINLAKQYYLMGYYYTEIANNSEKAFKNYTLSKSFYEQIGNLSWVGINLLNMGTIQKDYNDFFGSKETLTEALQFLVPKDDIIYIAQCYNLLATNHRKLLNYSEAIKYYNKAITASISKKDRLIYQNNLAATYIDGARYADALKLFEHTLQDSLLGQDQLEYARVLDNLAYAKWLSGKEHKAESFLGGLEIRIQNNDKRGLIASYTHLGEFYSKANPEKAKPYFDKVIQLSKTLKNPRAEKDALKFLMDLEPKNVKLRDRYVFLQDSLYQQELKVKTQFAKYKYDDKIKQESILHLEKENAEKELEASQQRTQKIIYLGSFLFITTVFGLSLYSFRQRTKRLKQKNITEKLEAIHETEAELSRKLHDDHGGKLNQAMLMVQRDTDKSAILDKLESVYNQIRNFSREINAVDTGPNFWKSLKATLEYTKPTEVDMTFDGGKELDWSLVDHQPKMILFKVLLELVMNMAKHSRANQTVILFRDQKKELSVYYEDDGVGASKASLLRKNGLQNTEKRIQAIGGSITFDSEEGKGFRVEIRIPK